VKSDPDAETVQTPLTVEAPPAKKGRGRAKMAAPGSTPLPPKENEQHTDEPVPPAPPIATTFQFTAGFLFTSLKQQQCLFILFC
jgi:hypothetical protein